MSTIIYAALGYFFLLLAVQVLSRRPGAQLTLFEFVIVFLIGGVIILSTVGSDRSATNCAIAIIAVARAFVSSRGSRPNHHASEGSSMVLH
jgi:uncharacterized membrane protein YcaP (DUF421 family)